MDFRPHLINSGEQTLKVFFRNLLIGTFIASLWAGAFIVRKQVLVRVCVTAEERLTDSDLGLSCFLRETFFFKTVKALSM